MEAKDTDIFISYRRVDGRDIARSIQLALGKEGFEHVFFDYSSMREGLFNEQIITAINNCKDYILVLSPQSMLRCGDPEDWVAKELQTAIEAGCKIIPVQINEPFDAWPQDFPKKFNFIKQIEFLTLRTDEYFPDSIRRLIGWLDSKPTRIQEKQDSFTLNIHVDETCELYVNGTKIRKVKGGKTAVLTELKRGQTYNLKFASLAQRNSKQEVTYVCPNDTTQTGDVSISFVEARRQQQLKIKQQRIASAQAKEQAYQQQGRLMQACEYYDESGRLSDGMVAVSLKGKIGFIDENGFEAVACEYENVVDFHGGYTSVCKYGKWGIIDKIGQLVVPLHSDTPCWLHGVFFLASQNGHYAISTINQGVPTNFLYDEVIILINHDNLFAVKRNSLWSIIDATGSASPFSIQVKSIYGSDYSYRYYSTFHSWDWKRVGIKTPLAVQHPGTERWGYLNSQLKQTIPFVDEESGESTYGSLEIIKTNGHMGLVNVETGDSIISAIYDNIHDLHHGNSLEFFRVSDGGSSDKCKKDEKGSITYNDMQYVWGGKQGIVNSKGEIIVPQHYQYIDSRGEYEDDHPFFVAYLLKDLQLSWRELYGNTMSLHRQFDKEQSAIHIYASDGTIIKKIKYSDESQIRDIINKAMKINR